MFLSGYKDMAQFIDEMPAMQRLGADVRPGKGERDPPVSVYLRKAK
jgi:hypothetical protein